MLFLDVWSGHVKKSDFLIEKISKKKQTLNTLETLLLVSGQTIMSFFNFSTLSISLLPGKAPLSQRTVRSPAGPAPPPGTWRPVHLQLAGRGHSCRHPTATH